MTSQYLAGSIAVVTGAGSLSDHAIDIGTVRSNYLSLMSRRR
jgi:hypothetical protein